MNNFIALGGAFGCGILSAMGVGGGSLLIILMTVLAGIPQQQAQLINLLYFIPTAGAGVWFHHKNKLIDRSIAAWAIVSGCVFAIAGSMIAVNTEGIILRKLFSVLLIIIGVSELFRREKEG
jgi:uncharacterized membrane protein YfcA